MPWATVTSDVLLATAFVATGVVLALVVVYVRMRRHRSNSTTTVPLDLAASTRQLVSESHADHKRIAEAQQELAKVMGELQKLLGAAAGSRDTKSPAPVLQVLASPEDSERAGNPTDHWVGLDLGDEEAPRATFEVPETVPEEPKQPEAAREIFRALLKIEGTPYSAGSDSPNGALKAGPEPGNGNEQDKYRDLRARVYQYSDTEMTVPQIAHELGIGKGEVRLLLSLREKN